MDNLQFNNENQNAPQKPDQQQLIKYGVIAVVAIVALILIVSLFGSLFGGSYKKTIKNAIKLVNKQVEDDLEYAKYSTFGSAYDFRALEDELMDADDDEYEDIIDELKDEFGDNYKVKYKIDDAEKIDKDDLEDLTDLIEEIYEGMEDNADDTLDYKEELWDEEDLSSSEQKKLEKAFEKYMDDCGDVKITAGYEVDLDCTIKGKEDKEEFRLKNLIILKVNGDWIFYGTSITPQTIYNEACN